MSINSAMLAGVSGLITNSSSLAAISDNIANVNTTAYKRNQVNFANVVTAQAVKGRYSSGGVQAVTRQFIGQQGLIQSASSATDLGISGDGFFVVSTKGANLTPADTRVFTRSGSFSVDEDGYLVNDAGLYLQGWHYKDDGSIDISPSDLTKMKSINIRDLGGAVKASSNVIINANLNKNQAVSADIAAYDAAVAGSRMASYADDPLTGVKPDFTIEMNVVDSAGGTHRIAMAFLKADAPAVNTWHAEIYSIPAGDVDSADNDGLIMSGNVAFNPDGTMDLDPLNTTLFADPANPLIALDASGGAQPAWAANLGIEASNITLDLARLTQYASSSVVNSVNPDGATVGTVVGVQVGEDGVVSAVFDNSEIRKIAMIGLATFPNPDGLQPVSGNAYRATIKSGEFAVKQPGTGGAGAIAPSTLEASTVDLSSEFTGLITTQKAYSACSKIITTADQMLDELINIKR
ncbi:MAG: flagellar hook protein FlgE [Phenylobacterium sp.]|jgi:flagellar hook protein FlgE|uniref:flagellar hook protein FlgE n=1 Tax=Phenylobacterium sp. TaxID=1871053 RepID=UPI00391CD5B1